MPGAEVVVGLIAGGFNVGSFFLGSAPDAISRLNNQSTVNVDLKMAEGNAEFVLQTLMDYGKVITIEEYKWLKGAYLNYKEKLNMIEDAQEDPPQKDDYLFKVGRVKTFRKLTKEKRIRKAVQELLDNTVKAHKDAVTISAKFRFKEVVALGKNKAPTTPNDRRPTLTHQNNTYPPAHSRIPDDETDSMISRVFKPRRLRTAGSPSGKSREEPVDGQVPPIDSEADSDIDEVDLGEPLSRVDTVDTFVSIYSSTPLVDKA